MYAIVDIAGQQFKVEAGSEIFVNRLASKKDESVEFNKVLLIDNEGTVKVGAPYVEGAVVKAHLILVFSMITNYASMAYRSFIFSEILDRGSCLEF